MDDRHRVASEHLAADFGNVKPIAVHARAAQL